MNPFILYRMHSNVSMFKSGTMKKIKKYKPIDNQGVKDISLVNNRECLNLIKTYFDDYDVIKGYIADRTLPDFIFGNDILITMVSHSLYLWMSSHMVNYRIDPDLVQISSLDELNKFVKMYRKVLRKVYKKYAMPAVRHLLKYDSYINQFENGSNHNLINELRKLSTNGSSVEDIREAMNENCKNTILQKLSLEIFKGQLNIENFKRSLKRDSITKSVIRNYLVNSFVNGNSTKTIQYFRESNFDDAIDYHMDSLITEIQDYAMVTNNLLLHDGEKFVGFYEITNDDKTRLYNQLILKKSDVRNMVSRFQRAKVVESPTVRYNPSRILNYVKLKKGADAVIEVED